MNHLTIISGSREWTDGNLMVSVLAPVLRDSLFVTGANGKADIMAANILRLRANEIAVPFISRLGLAGGPVRNQIMVDMGVAFRSIGYSVSVYAFPIPTSKSKSRGTYDLIRRAKGASMNVIETEC